MKQTNQTNYRKVKLNDCIFSRTTESVFALSESQRRGLDAVRVLELGHFLLGTLFLDQRRELKNRIGTLIRDAPNRKAHACLDRSRRFLSQFVIYICSRKVNSHLKLHSKMLNKLVALIGGQNKIVLINLFLNHY